MLNKLAKRADRLLDKASPRWGGGRIGNIVSDLKKSVEGFEQDDEGDDGRVCDVQTVHDR